MKALAAEMVRNFGSRLEPLGISVRELTGDMSLTKSEILKTQVNLLFKLYIVYMIIISVTFKVTALIVQQNKKNFCFEER